MEQRYLAAAVVCLAVLAAPGSAPAQQSDRPTVAVTRLADGRRPAIDGKVDDEVWDGARPYGTFTQQEPNHGQPATERTEVRFLMDRTHLYIGVVAFDSEPDRILLHRRALRGLGVELGRAVRRAVRHIGGLEPR